MKAVQEMGFPAVPAYHAWLGQAGDVEALASGWVLHTLLTDGE